METLCIRLFGKPSIRRGKDEIHDSLPSKAQELLVYLLLYRDRWHTREQLAAELWPEASSNAARSRLRRLMWRLHDGLGEDPSAARLLAVEGDWLGINRTARLWLDVAVVDDVYRQLGTVAGGLTAELAAHLEAAIDLIRGDLLANWYQEWCIVERERFRIIQISVLSRLMNHHVARGKIEQGVVVASQLLQVDQAHEGAHRQLMRLRYMAGDRTGALRQFEICKQALDEVFRVAPDRLTLELYDELRRNKPTSCHKQYIPPSRRTEVAADQASVEFIHSRLDRLQEQIIDSQNRIARELHTLQATIRASLSNGHHGSKRR